MTSPHQLASLIAVGAKALLFEARRLGLTWSLRPATVVNGDRTQTIQLRLDGDTVVTRAISMVGPIPAGARVHTMRVPPSGLYVVGWVGPPAGVPMLVRKTDGDQTVTNSTALVDVTQLAFTAEPQATYRVEAIIVYGGTTATSGGRDIRFAWSAPTNTAMRRNNLAYVTTPEWGSPDGVGVGRSIYSRQRDVTTQQLVGATGEASFNTYWEDIHVTTGDVGGVCQLQFAQAVAAAGTSAVVREGHSRLYVTRMLVGDINV